MTHIPMFSPLLLIFLVSMALLGMVAKIAFSHRWPTYVVFLTVVATFCVSIRKVDLFVPVGVVGLPFVALALIGIGLWKLTRQNKILIVIYCATSVIAIASGAIWTSTWIARHEQGFPSFGVSF